MLAAGWHPQPHRRPTPSRLHRLTRRRRRITSKKRAEFIRGHTNNGQDVSQRPFGHVPTCVDWDWDGSAIRVLHHVVTTDDPQWIRYLAFRDRLRADPHARTEYQQLKQQLAREFPTDRVAYTVGKETFIQGLLRLPSTLCNVAGQEASPGST